MRKIIQPCGFHCIKINNLGVSFGEQTVLEDVNMHIHCGSFNVIIGQNGAGKSTLIKAILGEIPHTGTIEFKRLMDNLFAVLVALIVMLSIKWIGILIINALLILPAASSRNISSNMREYHLFSVLFSVFSGIVGLAVSYYTNVATGPMIVIIASVIYFTTFIYGRKSS